MQRRKPTNAAERNTLNTRTPTQAASARDLLNFQRTRTFVSNADLIYSFWLYGAREFFAEPRGTLDGQDNDGKAL